MNGIARLVGGRHSHIRCGAAVALALVAGTLASLPATAQSSAAKPTCAVGDAVVWENTSTKVYHLSGDKFYGNTKHGAYACRSAADGAGYHLAGAKSGSKSPGSMSSAAPAGSPAPQESQTPAGTRHGRHHHSNATASPTPSPAAT